MTGQVGGQALDLHPRRLTKQEPPDARSIPVLKANVLISFTTGVYPYRQMCSLFFHRETGDLIKAVGSSQKHAKSHPSAISLCLCQDRANILANR